MSQQIWGQAKEAGAGRGRGEVRPLPVPVPMVGYENLPYLSPITGMGYLWVFLPDPLEPQNIIISAKQHGIIEDHQRNMVLEHIPL